uniref:Peptidase S1 domain-containing protein n=1 Tax=Peromyscus maniculatus bairdii TaxID=230844 RepID=A0A8C8TKF7_PERMB
MPPVLILLTLLLPLGAGGEEIIGGHEVKPHSRPYMTFIKYVDANGNRKRCGGFLVRDNFVLTAAHCLGSSMTVTLGAHNIKAQEETQQIIPVEKDDSSDIMLLKVRPANMTKVVRPLKLPWRKVPVKPGDVCSVAGWGKMVPEGNCADTLQEVELTVQMDQLCEFHYRRYYNKANEICVGDPKIKHATLQGDSGGPLLCNKVVKGIVSYGHKDGSAPRETMKRS